MDEKFLTFERMGDTGAVGKVAGARFFTAGKSEHFVAHSAFAPRAEGACASEVVGGFAERALVWKRRFACRDRVARELYGCPA